MELTSDNVETILIDCLHKDGEEYDESEGIIECIVNSYKFHSERLESHRDEIRSMIWQLPSQFLASGGGGWSFLNLCMRADGVQWTGMHRQQEKLYALAAGLGMAAIQFPREMWSILPGGMPYMVFDPDAKVEA